MCSLVEAYRNYGIFLVTGGGEGSVDGGREEDEVSHRDKMVDSVMGVRRITFKRAYNATRLNSNYVYNSITMMMVSHVIIALDSYEWPKAAQKTAKCKSVG